MLKSRSGFVVVMLAGLGAGCGQEADAPLSGPTVSYSAMGIEASASGSGILSVTAPAAAVGPASFEFTAKQFADGRVQGNFSMIRQRAGFHVEFEGEVTCVSFDHANHRAWIGGRVTRNNSDDPNHSLDIHQPGQDVWFRVVDNGEGDNANPDRSSVYGFKGAAGVETSPQYCALQLWTAGDVNAFEVVDGNVQVRAH